MAEVTAPLMLDTTGQAIVTAIQNLTIAGGVKFEFVNALPATGEEGTFYFVRNSSSTGDNLYDEYVWDEDSERFELIAAKIIIDATPTSGSANPVSSGGVYTALGGKQDTLTFDNAPTANSSNPVKSGGVYTAMQNQIQTTTTDPGEGAAMTGQLLIVYEEEE